MYAQNGRSLQLPIPVDNIQNLNRHKSTILLGDRFQNDRFEKVNNNKKKK